MGRINRWLLRLMDKMPDPEEPLPPNLDQIRIIFGRRVARAVLSAVAATAVYVFISRMTMHLWFSPFITVPVIVALSFFVTAVVEYQIRMGVYDYAQWLRTQRAVPSRVLRFGVPYGRRAPVATKACQDCPATPGERHDRSCLAVPPQWYR